MIKPMLASDWDEKKIKFPCYVQPKIDGVRGLNLNGQLTGRSLKSHANKHVTAMFSNVEYIGFDGELAAEIRSHPDLCRLTTSAINRIEGTPNVEWYVFDFINKITIQLPYVERFTALQEHLQRMQKGGFCKNVRLIETYEVHNLVQLIQFDDLFLKSGYEGSIIRDPQGFYKQGRSTVKEGGLLRIKRFTDAEALIVGIEEGMSNNNEKTTNELGLSARSSHKENLVPNGTVGVLICEPLTGGERFKVSPGKMTAEEKRYYFLHQTEIIGKITKYKHFEHGSKDAPRFATHQSFRALSDIS